MAWTTRRHCSEGLHCAFISDIHLGHHRTHSTHIIQNLRRDFARNEDMRKLDIIFIAGDAFDRLLNLPQEVVDEIQLWMSDFLRICQEYDVIVRVLEGTPSHDWKQNRQFMSVNATLVKPAKIKYIDTLSIETIDELDGLTVLYVPDEWNDKAQVTQEQVKDLLKIHNLTKVNISCMHGHFDYQLPIDSPKSHDADFYQAITEDYITIGHVHHRSTFGKILAQGSYDRLSHGEEAPKGHYRCILSDKGNRHWFVENPGAKLYITIDCTKMDVAQLMSEFVKLSDYPMKTHFRLQLTKESTAYNALHSLRDAYPQFVITSQLIELGTTTEQLAVGPAVQALPKAITVTPQNLGSLVKHKLDSFDISEANINNAMALLQRILDKVA